MSDSADADTSAPNVKGMAEINFRGKHNNGVVRVSWELDEYEEILVSSVSADAVSIPLLKGQSEGVQMRGLLTLLCDALKEWEADRGRSPEERREGMTL